MVALAVFNLALTIGFAYFLSHFIAFVFGGGKVAQVFPDLICVAVLGLIRACLVWGQEWLAGAAATAAKRELRNRFLTAITSLGPRWLATKHTANLTLLATHLIDALDGYFARFVPSLVASVVVTPVITAVIFANDLWSGLAVICTLPLIPLFMIFIGWATQALQRQQLDSLTALSRHFAEVLRGLTTLRVFSRLDKQPQAIAASAESFRRRTMRVLRMSFLSGMALEVAASLSVALVAVSIGLRLIDGSLTLGIGLFVLILAPEAYLPLRQVGANFHASNEGIEASRQILDVIDHAGSPSAAALPHSNIDSPTFRSGKVTQLTGASGAGKTTALANFRSQLAVSNVTWMPQNTRLLSGTVLLNIVGPAAVKTGHFDSKALELAVDLAALDDVQLNHQVGDSSSGLSGGQAQRVALARAFYRTITTSADWLLLDEPLSALDQVRSQKIQESIQLLNRTHGKSVVMVSHQPVWCADESVAVSDV